MDEKLALVLQQPINFNKILIHQPTLQDILDYGFDKFDNLFMPFLITKKMLHIDTEKYANLDIFDLFLVDNSPLQIKMLDSLSFFCKTDEIILTQDRQFKIGNGTLNKDNFKQFGDILLKVFGKSRPKEQEDENKFQCQDPKNLEKVKQIHEILMAHRKKNEQKNQLYLWDIIKIVEVGGKNYIPLENILKMTMWNIIDLYASILNIECYQDKFEIFLVSGDKSVIDKHWVEQIKIK